MSRNEATSSDQTIHQGVNTVAIQKKSLISNTFAAKSTAKPATKAKANAKVNATKMATALRTTMAAKMVNARTAV